ncbi:MAG: chemotaxis protein CheX [Leptospirales bacterium]|nr:chemotaxis protein CheX [Leptospirales bacterium]
MKDVDLKIFVEGAVRYFSQIAGDRVEMAVPFLKKPGETVALDCTGVIGISGNRKGMIYFTSGNAMLGELVHSILGGSGDDAAARIDLAGEIANTIAGNAREQFGADFMISIPVVVEGALKNITTPNDVPVYVAPIKWRSYTAYLVIGIQ